MAVRAETQIDLARVDDGTPGVSPTATVTKTGDTATITITDVNQTTTASVSDGTDGTNGVSVTAVEPQYYLSTSDSSATGGSWSSTPAAFVSGRYYWTRNYITFSDGTHDTSTAVYNSGMTKAAQDAYDAKTLADDTNQYFWYAPTGADTGAHITEVPQDEWNDSSDPNYHSGGNLLARSNGIALRDGMEELATLGQSGLDVNTYDGNGNTVNIAHLGYGPGTNSGGGTSNAPYYTLGTRLANSTVGNYSTAEGINVTSSGAFCHAEGSSTTASGMSSHAEGRNTQAVGGHSHAQGMNTIAQGLGQTVIGMYNAVQGDPQVLDYSDYAFIIGNGFDDNSRSNALTVDWNGKISTPQIQGGTSACPSISANSYADVTVTFDQAFSSVPLVICCLGSTSTAGAIGSLSVAVYSTTVSSVTFRVFNAGASSRQPSIRWFGINI